MGLNFHLDKNKLYFSLEVFRKMAFPSELFSSFDIGYQHGPINWNKISETEYKEKRLQKLSEEYAKQIKIIENILIMITFETNYNEKNKFLFQRHFQKLKEIYNEYIWIIINVDTNLKENKLKVIEWSSKSKNEINTESKKREYNLNYEKEKIKIKKLQQRLDKNYHKVFTINQEIKNIKSYIIILENEIENLHLNYLKIENKYFLGLNKEQNMSRYDIRILKYEKLRLKGEKINDLKKYKTKIESLNNFSKVLEAEIFYKKLNLEKIENKINSQVSTKFIL